MFFLGSILLVRCEVGIIFFCVPAILHISGFFVAREAVAAIHRKGNRSTSVEGLKFRYLVFLWSDFVVYYRVTSVLSN